ncbi:unnamed protein product [Effrenium voratum]|uniref:ShKT domain-containing protein n=1 Tax=Effrenium voratum TaxID=2562239 RepID=A0AA36IS17_9DINO|nr:unnamed protein product [Effrenium voratum]
MQPAGWAMAAAWLVLWILAEGSDQSEFCGSWAAAGECTRNAAYMLKACPESCGAQNGCKEWAAAGECEKNPNFMLKVCAAACDSPKAAQAEPSTATSEGGLSDPTERAEKAEALLQQARKDLEEMRRYLSEANKLALEELERQNQQKLRQIELARAVAEEKERQLRQALESTKSRAALLEEQLAAVRAAAPGSARPAPQAPHPTPRPRRRPVEPIYPLVVPEEAEKACEGALLELCGRHLDGQNPQLKELLVACRHGIENEKQLEQLLPEVKITRARDARAARDAGDLDAGTCANNRNASELNSTEDVPAFFSGIRCEGVCSSGLALAAVKAALQQSLQLLLDGALLLLNHGLGADPDKGRAAAAKAAGIGRALRAQLAARAVQRWDELAQGEVKKVLTRSGAALQRWGAAWALRLSSAWATLLGNLPPERRTWLPQDPRKAECA